MVLFFVFFWPDFDPFLIKNRCFGLRDLSRSLRNGRFAREIIDQNSKMFFLEPKTTIIHFQLHFPTSENRYFFSNRFFLKEKHTFWRSSGSKLGGKIDEKSMWKSMRKQKGLNTQFWSIFDRFGSHLGPPKRSQDAQKSMLK